MDNKGSFIIAGEMWMLVVKLFFLILVAFAVFAIISIGVTKKFDFASVEEQVIFSAIYMSECVNYKDLRIYPGVVDLEKFSNGNLDDCFEAENLGSRVTLSYEDKKIEKFIDEGFFGVESRFCAFSQYECPNLRIPVIVKDKDVFRTGDLLVEVVLKNV